MRTLLTSNRPIAARSVSMCFSEKNARPFNSNIKHSIRDKETAHLNPDMFSQGTATDRQIEFPFAQQAQPLRDPGAKH
ncbi:hypothetical protein QYH69_13295 [Paraburkholderia sp. SARCC-3016]|uniref:hypothetical protein n=1 Tax=Paraburkholderia sp. SARCC-3016 TaxID=3058611 RepID=UPI0028075BF8|nr:hypothetical protein [Paraburkholderia sp. SARCC-3016]MDQ7978220.1 hypothetical protein [Paraburkholderia sp. SARCC-3016]